MEKQMNMFDLRQAKKARDRGMSIAKIKRKAVVNLARKIAIEIARNGDGTCDAGKLAKYIWKEHKIDLPKLLGNATGSLFKTKEWEPTGEWVPHERKRSHARYIRVWRIAR